MGLWRGVGHQISVSAIVMHSHAELFGGGFNNVYLTKVYCVFILHVISVHLYQIKPIPLVRPSSPSLPQGSSMFGLGLGRKIRCSMALVPC